VFRFIRKSFSAKIITLVVVNVIITSFIIGAVTMHSTESFLTEKISEKFPSILLNTKGKVDLWYANKSMDLAVLSRSRVLIRNLAKFFAQSDSTKQASAIAEIKDYFAYIREKFPIYEDFAVLDQKGNISFASSDSVVEYADILRTLKEENGDISVISQAIHLPGEESISQWVLIPVRLKPGLGATICARFELQSIEHLLSDVNLSAYGDIYLLDFRGCFLTQPRGVEVSMLGEKAMEVPTRQEGPILVEKYKNYAGRKVFGSKIFLADRGWWLVCEEDYEASMAPVLDTRNKIIVADLLICSLFILIALKIIRSILKPVRALSEGAKKVKEGMVGVNIPTTSEDEIGLMISTFNEMAKTISLAKVELQAKNKMLNTQNITLQEMNEKLERLSITDGLTGLFNHRHFWNIMNSELTRANLYKGDIALILIDVDDFKKVNDNFGHSVGDMLLQNLANTLKETVRETDIVARYGGEEFAVLLPDTNLEGVKNAAEKIRKAIEAMVFKIPETDITTGVTVSIGISVFQGNRRDFFNAADRALYISKSKGKNKVSMAEVEA
jgi:diguanylate cyclase (GGDEF)-like protein